MHAVQFLDPEGGSQKATLVVLVVVVGINSLKSPKAFLVRSAAQQNCLHIHAHSPYRSPVYRFCN